MARFNLTIRTLLTSALVILSLQSNADDTAEAYIVSPQDGDIVSSPVTIVFGLRGMGVAPAGVERQNTGHHHLLVDTDELPPLDQPLGGQAIHFGGGQTQTTIELTPGEHTLQLILGDHLHRPHQPPVISKKIRITVKKTIEQLDIKNLKAVSPSVYRSGQPTAEQFRQLAALGIQHVISLRPDHEMDWNQSALLRELGITNTVIPVSNATDVTFENAEKLSSLLKTKPDEATLVHCASSNRVGALIALNAIRDGATPDEAIAIGKDWGLTRLEPIVRERLQAF